VIAARTDVVGSLLRPPELLEARERLVRGELAAPAFKRIEDRAVDEAIRLQEEAGLEVVTDGEMRRLSFQSQLTEAVDGFGEWDLDAFLWGEWHGAEVGDSTIERPPIGVVARLSRRRFLSAEELTYARGRTERVVKVTLPSPSLFANFYDPERSRDAYPTLEEFLGDVAEILREEVDVSFGSEPNTCSSTLLTTRSFSIRAIGTSTRAGGGRPSAGSTSASSSTTWS
jgi:5-methyltetrahydropteroyltriglutamate--homocysteine methyltransferase